MLPDSFLLAEAATRGVLCKKVFLEISENLQESTCARASFLIKVHAILKIKFERLREARMISFKCYIEIM